MEATQTITQNTLRIGRFTSSNIAALMSVAKDKIGFGKPALTYIAEKNMERRLGRSLSIESNAHALTWGRLVEKRAFDILGTEYKLCSADTLVHEDNSVAPFWAGSPDLVKYDEGGTVVDIKCPITLKSFCQFADCKTIEQIREEHPDGEDYYWQLVSNAILTKSKYAELIVYCPYKSELQEIRDMAANYDGDQTKMFWIDRSADEDLPYLLDGGYYKNINTFRFEVPYQDILLLTEKVLAAGKLLVEYKISVAN